MKGKIKLLVVVFAILVAAVSARLIAASDYILTLTSSVPNPYGYQHFYCPYKGYPGYPQPYRIPYPYPYGAYPCACIPTMVAPLLDEDHSE
jgi:hypothetical protein